MMTAAKKKRVVRNVNWFVDAHYKLKQKRDALLGKVDDVKQDITKLEAEALHKFGKEGIEGAKGKLATGFIQELDHVRIADRRALDAYVKRTGHMELFQNRVSAEAYRELLAQRKKPAGVEIYTSVHFRTRKR
jgi:hypothetical protein